MREDTDPQEAGDKDRRTRICPLVSGISGSIRVVKRERIQGYIEWKRGVEIEGSGGGWREKM